MNASASLFPPSQALRFLVVEDHPVYLEGLGFILNDLHPELELICVESADAAQDYLSRHTNIDLVILDLGVPGGGGIAVLDFLRAKQIFVPAVVLSASEEPCDVQRALNAGAGGFISKASNSKEIVSAIRKVIAGEETLPPFYAKQEATHSNVETPSLTPRQKEVLKLVCEGLPNKRICQILNLSEHTVKSHLKALFALLQVHNRTECMRVAIEWRLLDS